MCRRRYKIILSIFILLFSILQVKGQSYSIGHITLNLIDPSRNNRNIQVELYYPSDAAGDNVAIASGSEDFPVVTFGHGFLMSWDAYENIWTPLVGNGFIVAFPRTEGGLAPSHFDFGLDLAFVTIAVSAFDSNPSSMFFNRIADLNAVMGHSMGGGAALLSAAGNPAIDAVAVLAPAETNPSAIAAAGQISKPAMIIAGANDCVTPPATNQFPMYGALQSDCKTYISITGGSHCQMANSNFFCGVGEASCSPAPAIPRAEQHQVINNYLVNWLKSTLKADCEAGTIFDEQISEDSAITYEKNCELCGALSVGGIRDDVVAIYPNPFSDELIIERSSGGEILEISDMQGRMVFRTQVPTGGRISAEFLTPGIYIYRIVKGSAISAKGKLIKK